MGLFLTQLDSCIEAFGSTKQKRALNSRRINKVASECLNVSVAKAAESIIDTKGVNGKRRSSGWRLGLQRLESSHRCKWWALRLGSFLLLAEGLLRSDSGSRRDLRHHPVLSQGGDRHGKGSEQALL